MHLLQTLLPWLKVAKDVTVGTWVDFTAIPNPPSPPAGFVRHHALTTQGFTRLEQDNEAATNITLGRDNVFIVRNTSGSDMTAAKAVYVTGSTGNVPNVSLAKSDAATTLPAIGILLDAIGNNNFGQCMKAGIIASINTSAFTAGDLLYIDATTAGTLTKTRPVYPNLAQCVGSVLVSGVGNGAIIVFATQFIGGLESGTLSTAWTAAGTIKPAQATPNAYLSSDSSAGISTTITTASLVGKTITVKDGIITGFA